MGGERRGRAGARLQAARMLILLACVFCTGCKLGEVLKGLFIAVAATLLMGSLFGTLGKGGAGAAIRQTATSHGTSAVISAASGSGGSSDGESSPAVAGTAPDGSRPKGDSDAQPGSKLTESEIRSDQDSFTNANNPFVVKENRQAEAAEEQVRAVAQSAAQAAKKATASARDAVGRVTRDTGLVAGTTGKSQRDPKAGGS